MRYKFDRLDKVRKRKKTSKKRANNNDHLRNVILTFKQKIVDSDDIDTMSKNIHLLKKWDVYRLEGGVIKLKGEVGKLLWFAWNKGKYEIFNPISQALFYRASYEDIRSIVVGITMTILTSSENKDESLDDYHKKRDVFGFWCGKQIYHWLEKNSDTANIHDFLKLCSEKMSKKAHKVSISFVHSFMVSGFINEHGKSFRKFLREALLVNNKIAKLKGREAINCLGLLDIALHGGSDLRNIGLNSSRSQLLERFEVSSPIFEKEELVSIKSRFITKIYSSGQNLLWNDIPRFAVLTGVNASGKTRIINSIMNLYPFYMSLYYLEGHTDRYKLRSLVNPVDIANGTLDMRVLSNLAEYVVKILTDNIETDSLSAEDLNNHFQKWEKEEKSLLSINYVTMSSGEKAYFELIALSFFAPKLGIKLILLDEFDKHLDPGIIKKCIKILESIVSSGIQVIMTDTIACIPDDVLESGEAAILAIQDTSGASVASNTSGGASSGAGIPSVDHNPLKEIVQITKMHAMYKLTRNFREFSGHHFRVYCESTDDALFYEGAYNSLMEICEAVPMEQLQDGREWYLPNGAGEDKVVGRLLSRRYQMSFQSVSKRDKEDGGCSQVIDKVQRDYNAYQDPDISASRTKRSLLWHKEFHIPYGVVDNDGVEDRSDLVLDSKERIVIPRAVYNLDQTEHFKINREQEIVSPTNTAGGRYSLENYIFDPVIFCSLLTEVEIREIITGSLIIEQEEVIECCTRIKRWLENSDQRWLFETYMDVNAEINKYFYYIFSTVSACISKPDPELRTFLKSKNIVFNERDIERAQKLRLPFTDGVINDKQKACFDQLRLRVTTPTSRDLKTIPVYYLSLTQEHVSIFYPKEFLEFRGHNFETFCFGKSATTLIAKRMSSSKFIPLDLAALFFELNTRIRLNIYPAVKPQQIARDIDLTDNVITNPVIISSLVSERLDIKLTVAKLKNLLHNHTQREGTYQFTFKGGCMITIKTEMVERKKNIEVTFSGNAQDFTIAENAINKQLKGVQLTSKIAETGKPIKVVYFLSVLRLLDVEVATRLVNNICSGELSSLLLVEEEKFSSQSIIQGVDLESGEVKILKGKEAVSNALYIAIKILGKGDRYNSALDIRNLLILDEDEIAYNYFEKTMIHLVKESSSVCLDIDLLESKARRIVLAYRARYCVESDKDAVINDLLLDIEEARNYNIINIKDPQIITHIDQIRAGLVAMSEREVEIIAKKLGMAIDVNGVTYGSGEKQIGLLLKGELCTLQIFGLKDMLSQSAKEVSYRDAGSIDSAYQQITDKPGNLSSGTGNSTYSFSSKTFSLPLWPTVHQSLV